MQSKICGYILSAILLLSLSLSPSSSLGAENPWQFLDDRFTPVPSSLTRIAEHYAAMLFIDREQELVAAVIFKTSCAVSNCELLHRAGYAVANAAGSNTRLYVEPRETELMELIGAIYTQYFNGRTS